MAGMYPGGFVTKSPVATVGPGGDFNDGGSASGMWTLDQALVLKSAGVWPTKTKAKYLWLWGQNNYGQLGDNTKVYRSSPIQLGALSTWSKIAASVEHTMAIKTDGTLWTWGRNHHGQLGDNTITARNSPVQVGALTTWSLIAGGRYHSIAIKTDGTLWSFGYNGTGPLGDNTTIKRSSPIQVGAQTTWSQISVGGSRSMAIQSIAF